MAAFHFFYSSQQSQKLHILTNILQLEKNHEAQGVKQLAPITQLMKGEIRNSEQNMFNFHYFMLLSKIKISILYAVKKQSLFLALESVKC